MAGESQESVATLLRELEEINQNQPQALESHLLGDGLLDCIGKSSATYGFGGGDGFDQSCPSSLNTHAVWAPTLRDHQLIAPPQQVPEVPQQQQVPVVKSYRDALSSIDGGATQGNTHTDLGRRHSSTDSQASSVPLHNNSTEIRPQVTKTLSVDTASKTGGGKARQVEKRSNSKRNRGKGTEKNVSPQLPTDAKKDSPSTRPRSADQHVPKGSPNLEDEKNAFCNSTRYSALNTARATAEKHNQQQYSRHGNEEPVNHLSSTTAATKRRLKVTNSSGPTSQHSSRTSNIKGGGGKRKIEPRYGGAKRTRNKIDLALLYFLELLQSAFQYCCTSATWLFYLIWDVALQLGEVLSHFFRFLYERLVIWSFSFRNFLTDSASAFVAWFKERVLRRGKAEQSDGAGIPTTGDEAMRRLLTSSGKDPYSVLGLEPSCTDDEIKRHYRKQATLVHPDKNRQPGSDEAFRILQHAFERIGTPNARQEYDSQASEKSEQNQIYEELLRILVQRMEEALNTMRCECGGTHKRYKTDRPLSGARYCRRCGKDDMHAVCEGDVWSESPLFGFFARYYTVMNGVVFDITEWARCKSNALKCVSNAHDIQYRLLTGAGGNRKNRQPRSQQQYSEKDLDSMLLNAFKQLSGAAGSASGGAVGDAASKRTPRTDAKQ